MSAERHRYEYDVDLNKPSAQATVVQMAGKDKRVLEIGAGPGSVTKALQEQGCRITALEVDSSALPTLQKHCDRVIQADLNEPSWIDSLKGEDPFEVVVIADVLEHLYDPRATLQKIKPLVAPGGCIVASLPHVGHASIYACLFNEDFSYQDWGLLDSTHIRFFGLKNMQALFNETGYEIIDATLVILPPENDIQFSAQWNGLPTKLRSAIQLNRFSNVYQVVIKAKPSATPNKGLRLMSLPTLAAHTVVIGPSEMETAKSRLKKGLGKIVGEKNCQKIWGKLSRIKCHVIH